MGFSLITGKNSPRNIGLAKWQKENNKRRRQEWVEKWFGWTKDWWCKNFHERYHQCLDDFVRVDDYFNGIRVLSGILPGRLCYQCYKCDRLWVGENPEIYSSAFPSFVGSEFVSDGTFKKEKKNE